VLFNWLNNMVNLVSGDVRDWGGVVGQSGGGVYNSWGGVGNGVWSGVVGDYGRVSNEGWGGVDGAVGVDSGGCENSEVTWAGVGDSQQSSETEQLVHFEVCCVVEN